MLEPYAQKRKFSRTPEPAGDAQAAEAAGPLRFVVQKHAARRVHYDFRIELDGALKSWAVPKGPSLDPSEKRLAVLVEDHPLEYATFEGVIPKGEYGAGEVIVWDAGSYFPDEPAGLSPHDRAGAEAAIRRGLEAGKISLTLHGQKLKGSWALVRMGSRPTRGGPPRADERDGGKNWLLIKHQDSYADPQTDILRDGRSVLTQVSVADLRAGRASQPDLRPQQAPGARPAPYPSGWAPMLPSLGEAPFSHPDWVFEPKLDGVRVIVEFRVQSSKFKVGGGSDPLTLHSEVFTRLVSRGGRDVTSQYPALVHSLGRAIEQDAVLDGEIVALDAAGRPSFQRLQERLHLVRPIEIRRADRAIPVTLYVFDLLYADGYELTRVPLDWRKRLLQSAAGGSPAEGVQLVESFPAEGETAYRAFVAYGLEGMIAKRADSLYEPGRRTQAWLKIKGTLSDDFVVVGYTEGTGARADTFGSLVLGCYDDEGVGGPQTPNPNPQTLRFVGHVGTGFDDRMLRELRGRLDVLAVEECPFPELPAGNAPQHWVRPELVAEVKFARWTQDGRLREPVFMRLREDKAPREAVRTEITPVPSDEDRGSDLLAQLEGTKDHALLDVGGHRLALSHLNKVLWPPNAGGSAVTKRDLIRHLLRVSPWLLPHLRGRPLTLVRCPDGLLGERFYQKHIELGLPEFVETVRLYSGHREGDGDYLLCNNLATLLWLGQLAALELHPWYSRVDPDPDGDHLGTQFAGSEEAIESSLLNYPDFVVFDLDPYIYSGQEAAGEEPELNRDAFRRTCDVAFWLKELLDGLGLASFLKTSGRTGLHVFVPILRNLDYTATRAACETLGHFLLRTHPREVTMEWTVSKRTGKVFFDHNQNVRGKTLASIFSPRLAPEAAVSVPLRWEELSDVYPTDFTVLTAAGWVGERGDPWADILDAKRDLEGLL